MAETSRTGTVVRVTADENGNAAVTIRVTEEVTNPDPPPPTIEEENEYSYELPDITQVVVASSAVGSTLKVTTDDSTPTKAKMVTRSA